MSVLPPEAAYWDARYAVDGRLWGDGPRSLPGWPSPACGRMPGAI